MKRTISNPNKVHYKMYLWIIGIAFTTLILSLIIPNCGYPFIEISLDVIKNLSYGCIASTVIAWIIDCVNVKNANKKANATYDAIYIELKLNIGHFIGTWAEVCAVSFKEQDYYSEQHSWKEWYKLTKDNFEKLDPERQQRLMAFFRDSLLQATQYVNRAIEKITSQMYMLAMNDAMNSDLRRIISDFQFEFGALDMDLSQEKYEEHFWNHMEAIVKDLVNYIGAWSDISFYNELKFKPYKFFDVIKVEFAKDE